MSASNREPLAFRGITNRAFQKLAGELRFDQKVGSSLMHGLLVELANTNPGQHDDRGPYTGFGNIT